MTTINRDSFFQNIRPLFPGAKLSPAQIDGINAIFDEWEKRELTDKRWLAYMLATVFHETGQEMQPVEEIGKGHNRPYGQKLKMAKQNGSHVPYELPDEIYHGRGLVQITWYEGYENMGKHLGISLLEQPHLALDLPTSVQIMFEGMTRGMFTGAKLARFFDDAPTQDDNWINARKIINGLDCADKIAGYGKKFFEALSFSETDSSDPASRTPLAMPIADNSKTVIGHEALNIRSGPGASFQIVGTLQPGEQVRVGEVQNGWCVVNAKGWVNMKFLQ